MEDWAIAAIPAQSTHKTPIGKTRMGWVVLIMLSYSFELMELPAWC